MNPCVGRRVRVEMEDYSYEGTFVAFGLDWETYDDVGYAHFTSAIIETDDGELKNVKLSRIQFINL
jgi:hypothetical protein